MQSEDMSCTEYSGEDDQYVPSVCEQPEGEAGEAGEDPGDSCRPARARIFLVTTVSFTFAVSVVLVMIMTNLDKSALRVNCKDGDDVCVIPIPYDDSYGVGLCYDVVIIGAGLSGTLTAWELRNHNKSIALYQTTDDNENNLRTTGIQHENFTFNIELGISWLENPSEELIELLSNFDLTPETDSFQTFDTEYFLRGKALSYRETDFANIYNLQGKYSGLKPVQILNEVIQDWISSLKPETNTTSFDSMETAPENQTEAEDNSNEGSPLSLLQTTSVGEVLFQVHGTELHQLIEDTLGSEILSISVASAVKIYNISEYQEIGGSNDTNRMERNDQGGQRIYIRDGLQESLGRLTEQFIGSSPLHVFRKNTSPLSIEMSNNRQVVMFRDEKGIATTCAKRLVLSTSPEMISRISMKYYHNEYTKVHQQLKQKLRNFYKQKIFLVFNNTWWTEDTSDLRSIHVQSDSPISQVYTHVQNPLNITGSMAYPQLPIVCIHLNEKYRTYWETLNRGKTSVIESQTGSTLSELFLEHVTFHLSKMFPNSSSIPDPSSYLVYLWNGQLYGETSYVWGSGVNIDETVDFLKKPIPDQNVHLVGSWFEAVPMQLDRVSGDFTSVNDFISRYFENV